MGDTIRVTIFHAVSFYFFSSAKHEIIETYMQISFLSIWHLAAAGRVMYERVHSVVDTSACRANLRAPDKAVVFIEGLSNGIPAILGLVPNDIMTM